MQNKVEEVKCCLDNKELKEGDGYCPRGSAVVWLSGGPTKEDEEEIAEKSNVLTM